MTSDLFGQKAELPQEFPAVRHTLFDFQSGDPPGGSHCLSGYQDLATVRH